MSAQPVPGTVDVGGGHALVGTLWTPGDKSISHRALLIGALAEGTTQVRGLSDGDDVIRSAAAIEALGAGLVRSPGTVQIVGGRERLHAAPSIDCANSGTTMRLLAGIASSLRGTTTLRGDPSLSNRPMDRVTEPLAAMGAVVDGRGARALPPLVVHGGPLRGIEWTPPMASAQVKSCLLLAGLHAQGETVVAEPVPTRAHTEEMLAQAGADIVVEAWGRGRRIRLRPSALHPLDIEVPGDPSQGAFWIVAACLIQDSSVRVRAVYGGPERLGFMGVLARMNASVATLPNPNGSADLVAEYGALTGTPVDAAEIPSLDEVPILAVAAAMARGTTVFRDVAELRVKESDRLHATVELVHQLGAGARIDADALIVEGPASPGRDRLRFHARGDHRLAMAAVIGALASPAGGVVAGVECVQTSYPQFFSDLDSLCGSQLWSVTDEAITS